MFRRSAARLAPKLRRKASPATSLDLDIISFLDNLVAHDPHPAVPKVKKSAAKTAKPKSTKKVRAGTSPLEDASRPAVTIQQKEILTDARPWELRVLDHLEATRTKLNALRK